MRAWRSRRVVVIASCVSVLVGAVVTLTMLGDLLQRHDAYAVIAIFATLCLLTLLAWLDLRNLDVSRWMVIAVAVAMRIAALPMSPTLTDDPWRYVWDGRLVLNGINPYEYAPSDRVLTVFRDELYELQGHPETPSVYPPLAQALFAVAAIPSSAFNAHTASYYVLKCLLLAIELVAISTLLSLLRIMRLPARNAMLYAWHPLVVVEFSGQGHLDGLWVAAIVLALYRYAVREDHGDRAGSAWLVAGTAARLYPAVLLPLWWRALGTRRFVRTLVPALPLALFAYPLIDADALASFATVVSRFTNYYEFNGGFYYAAKWLVDAIGISPSNAIAGGISVCAQLVVVALATRMVARNADIRSLALAALIVTTSSAALGAKAHVWYFAAPLALAALQRHTPLAGFWMWVTLVAPITYVAYTVSPPHEPRLLLAIEWGGGACALLWVWWRSRGDEQAIERVGSGIH